jgi:hypothetical protein
VRRQREEEERFVDSQNCVEPTRIVFPYGLMVALASRSSTDWSLHCVSTPVLAAVEWMRRSTIAIARARAAERSIFYLTKLTASLLDSQLELSFGPANRPAPR